jgi:hypothetical protein
MKKKEYCPEKRPSEEKGVKRKEDLKVAEEKG